eukprot:TRINITY_DN5572_c0_g1_i2.p1 TRINITY_DN5572_c0_g1~~TRINITY_DN5572_c0_g1_i2.p1  ORF type:complete len:210 (+),score=16.79 TRINITY_DN5572_c0_g1_i2:14-643(+)
MMCVFFSSRRRHTRSCLVSWARRCVQETDVILVEVGGGSTQVVYLEKGLVVFSQDYRLGCLRLREMLEGFRSPVSHRRELMEDQIDGMVNHLRKAAPLHSPVHLVVLGNDARFAALSAHPRWNMRSMAALPTKELARLTEEVLPLSVNDIVRAHHLSFPDAETLGPALLCYARLAKALRVREVHVADVSMRHGLLMEFAQHGPCPCTLR